MPADDGDSVVVELRLFIASTAALLLRRFSGATVIFVISSYLRWRRYWHYADAAHMRLTQRVTTTWPTGIDNASQLARKMLPRQGAPSRRRHTLS